MARGKDRDYEQLSETKRRRRKMIDYVLDWHFNQGKPLNDVIAQWDKEHPDPKDHRSLANWGKLRTQARAIWEAGNQFTLRDIATCSTAHLMSAMYVDKPLIFRCLMEKDGASMDDLTTDQLAGVSFSRGKGGEFRITCSDVQAASTLQRWSGSAGKAGFLMIEMLRRLDDAPGLDQIARGTSIEEVFVNRMEHFLREAGVLKDEENNS